MHIVLDARWIFEEISGIGEYTRQLLRQLPALAPEDRFSVIFAEEHLRERTVQETGLERFPNVTTVMLPAGLFSPKSQLLLPQMLRRLHADVFHSPNYMIPLAAFPAHKRGRTACVATIHDMIPFLFPDHAPKSRKTRMFPLYKKLMRMIAARTDAIITVSDASRRDIIECLNIAENEQDKVVRIYNGVSARDTGSRPAAPTAPIAKQKSRHFTALYVGRCDPYKNLDTLIRAIGLVETEPEWKGLLELKIAGTPDPRYPEAVELVRQCGFEYCIKWTGYLHDAELAQLYTAADFLVQPSRYEGFGLQVLEAMQAGLPVIAARGGALPEVCGSAALMVEAGHAEELRDAIITLMCDPAKADRLRKAGYENVKRFNWRKSAEETLAVYRQMM